MSPALSAALKHQLAWWVAVLLVREGLIFLGVVVLLLFVADQLWRGSDRWGEGLLVGLAGVVGLLGDGLLIAGGWMVIPPAAMTAGPSPAWLIALWLAFGAILRGPMSWLVRTPRRALALGLAVGPLAYLGGEPLGLLSLPRGGESLAAIGISWSVSLWLLARLIRALDAGPLDPESCKRRLITFPAVGLLALTFTLLAPLWIALAGLWDGTHRLLGRRRCLLRTLACVEVMLVGELWGLLALGWVWWSSQGDRTQLTEQTYRAQSIWVSWLLSSLLRIWRMRLEWRGEPEPPEGGLLVMIRHCSLVDTLLPTHLLTRRWGTRLRFVLKRELLWDPCLDLAGQRLPNVFIRRGSSDPSRELAALRALARGVGRGDGLLIYPEGTRFSRRRQQRAWERLAGRPELLERARRMERVLPPRLSGPLTLIDAAPVDLLFMAHSGLDGAMRWRELSSGALLDAVIKVRTWRVPASAIPSEEEARVDWLYTQWEEMNRVVQAMEESD